MEQNKQVELILQALKLRLEYNKDEIQYLITLLHEDRKKIEKALPYGNYTSNQSNVCPYCGK